MPVCNCKKKLRLFSFVCNSVPFLNLRVTSGSGGRRSSIEIGKIAICNCTILCLTLFYVPLFRARSVNKFFFVKLHHQRNYSTVTNGSDFAERVREREKQTICLITHSGAVFFSTEFCCKVFLLQSSCQLHSPRNPALGTSSIVNRPSVENEKWEHLCTKMQSLNCPYFDGFSAV